MVQHCPTHVQDNADHTGTDIMNNDNIPYVHAKTFSLDGFVILWNEFCKHLEINKKRQ
jgi:hypothetical protein